MKYLTKRNIYTGLDLVDKESKSIDYSTINAGYKFKNNIQSGISIKIGNNSSILASLSYDKNIVTEKTDYLFSSSIKSDLKNDNIYNLNFDIKRWLNDKINLFVLGKYIYFDEKDDFQFKIVVGIKI